MLEYKDLRCFFSCKYYSFVSILEESDIPITRLRVQLYEGELLDLKFVIEARKLVGSTKKNELHYKILLTLNFNLNSSYTEKIF